MEKIQTVILERNVTTNKNNASCPTTKAKLSTGGLG